MKLSELSTKDVIREEDGTKLGRINDVIIDAANGKILSILVSNGLKFFNFFSKEDATKISWQNIVKIGSDVIIVDTAQNKNLDTNKNNKNE